MKNFLLGAAAALTLSACSAPTQMQKKEASISNMNNSDNEEPIRNKDVVMPHIIASIRDSIWYQCRPSLQVPVMTIRYTSCGGMVTASFLSLKARGCVVKMAQRDFPSCAVHTDSMEEGGPVDDGYQEALITCGCATPDKYRPSATPPSPETPLR